MLRLIKLSALCLIVALILSGCSTGTRQWHDQNFSVESLFFLIMAAILGYAAKKTTYESLIVRWGWGIGCFCMLIIYIKINWWAITHLFVILERH
jgi:uncharacterized membrane protein YhaH (DUF805 family)